MAERGVRILLLVSERDPGAEYVDLHYPAEMRDLAETSGFQRFDFKGADHTFTSLAAQKLALDTVTEHLVREYLLENTA